MYNPADTINRLSLYLSALIESFLTILPVNMLYTHLQIYEELKLRRSKASFDPVTPNELHLNISVFHVARSVH